MVEGLAASLTVERQGTGGGEGVRHSAVETGVAAQAWDKSWEGKVAGHRGRGTGEAGVRDVDNTDPGGGQRYKRLRSDRQGSTYTG